MRPSFEPSKSASTMDGQRHVTYGEGVGSSRQVQKSSGYSTSRDILEMGKRTDRPLSLLVGGPLEENTSTSRARLSGSKIVRDSVQSSSWDSSLRFDRSQVSKFREVSTTKLAFQQSKLIGHGKKLPHPGRGMQSSFQLQSNPFPWEKTAPWEGSSADKDATKNHSPLSIQIASHEISFWKILRMHPHAVKLNQFMDSKYWASLIVPAVVIALFSHNVIKAYFPKAADPYLIYIYLVCLALFIFELVALSIVRKDYFLGLSFWLDLVGSVTLIPLILGMLEINLIMARAAQAAKSFTRAAKWMQTTDFSKSVIISTARLFRRKYKIQETQANKDIEPDPEHHYKGKPSQVWTRLSELTSQKLVLGMLVLVILIPNLRIYVKDSGPFSSLNMLDHSPLYSSHFNETLQSLYDFYQSHGYNLLYLGVKDGCVAPSYVSSDECTSRGQAGSTVCSGLDSGSSLFSQVYPPLSKVVDGRKNAEAMYRPAELLIVSSESGRSEALFSIKENIQRGLQYDMGATIIILLILSAWSFFLSWDSNKLLIQPIERMVRFVKELAEDPVSFAGKILPPTKGGEGKVMETRVVEAALIKIARLTKVALGDAGMDILSVNLKGTAFNPMIPGKKIRACFGFCDIRNFTDATECLQEDVMVFVNKIADLVHNKVVIYHGYPNKNIGDAFLLVWKKTFSDAANKKRGSSFADRALRSFLDVIYSVETSQTLQAYAMHPAIQRRMPGYRIRLGFGLHVGWAIEGAIGSSHKVDPSYLSPHVNMASRLEALTKQYGVVLLLSETVVSNLTKSSLRDNCRRLDRITVKGSVEPMILYTYDMPMFQKDLIGNYSEYKNTFEAAVDDYVDGKWHEALDKLHWCQHLWPTDKPIDVLIAFMASHKNMVPQNWKGFRELKEK
ncbi:hypothetical protein L7F22_020231 [Adiantum nelumboides]|nr:hypothetical protein [Adiantum nelumboides]